MRPHAPRLLAVDGLTAPQEAALLYGEGRTEDAIAILDDALTGEPAAGDAWRLLFALHRARGDAEAFDRLGRRYAAQCAVAPPPWLTDIALLQLPAELQPGGDAYVELAGTFQNTDGDDTLHARCARHSVVHLDATRIRDVEQGMAQRLSALLHETADADTGVFVSGAQRLIDMLRERLQREPACGAHWQLLLDLYRLQEREQDYERAALEYALHTGAQPPPWPSVVLPVVGAHSPHEKRSAPRYGGPESLALTGVVTSPRDPQLATIEREAAGRRYVNVELSDLSRLGPAAAQALVALTAAWDQAGKTVRLLRPDPLVEILLTMLSLPPRVQLIGAQFD